MQDSGKFILLEDVDHDSNLAGRIGPFSSIWDILESKHREQYVIVLVIPLVLQQEKSPALTSKFCFLIIYSLVY